MSLLGDVVKVGTFGLIDPNKKAPSAPVLPAAPAWKDSMIYDSEGRLAGSVTKDANGNIVYKPRQLTAAELTQKKGIESTRQTLLQRLYSTPEEYTKAAQTEADAWAGLQNQAAQEQFEKDVNRIGEVSNTRGLLGSSAWRDILREREKTQARTTSDIAGQATSMRQGLIDQKKAGDYNLYNLYGGAANQYAQNEANILAQAQGIGSQVNQFNQNSWATQTNAAIANYANQLKQYELNDPWRNYITPIMKAGATYMAGR